MGVKVQVIANKEDDHSSLVDFFKGNGYKVSFSTSAKKALRDIKKEKPDLVFLAFNLPDLNGIEVLKKVKKNGNDVSLFTLVDSAEQGIESMKLGAENYFLNPYNLDEVQIILDKYLTVKQYKERIEELRHRHISEFEKYEMMLVGKSMKDIYQQVLTIAEGKNVPVLISGELGTGKELLAKIIHIRSHQFVFPFVSINCKDRNGKVLDVQLSGTQKGTDSQRKRVEESHMSGGSTLFLCNIEQLTKADQIKVLKFLKGKKSGRGRKRDSSAIEKRIIAATNVKLKPLVDRGKFNKELYQEISKRTIQTLPLRKRSDDIIPLTMHFIKNFNKEYGKQVKRVDPDVRNYLESYDWPGNVSELKNVIEHVVILSQSESISMKEMEFKVSKKLISLDSLLMNGSFLSLDEMVNLYVNTVLKKVKGNKSKAAKLLKVSRNTLKKKSIVA
ncbi:MAG: sigma-54-dependent Fis family transcriptional regulator [Deltaproteobacteria bacterium]|nr:sigma-54-dependent Fis family transcriptional regulator [Deltaproteobacteria bacterium]